MCLLAMCTEIKSGCHETETFEEFYVAFGNVLAHFDLQFLMQASTVTMGED